MSKLNDMLKKPDGTFKFHLDQDELTQLHDALTEGGHSDVEDTVKKYDGAEKWQPEKIEPIEETESPTNLTIPNVEPNVETDPNIAPSSNPLTDTIPGLNEGTQMDMFDNEEN